jgi:shikimate 5-dehydrogenase
VDGPADAQLAATAPGTVVVNATGLGKDRPGSPLSDAATYPRGAVVWELNYRGSLEMLAHARSVATERDLTIVDGWRYFVHGWTQVIAEVLDLELTPDVVERLSETASAYR